MENSKTDFVTREQRFSLDDFQGVNVVVRRTDSEDAEGIPAKLLDFSRNGIKISMPAIVQFEEILLVRIEFDNSSLSYLGEACVRHMRANDEDKTWAVGCRLEPAIPDTIIEYLAENSGKERRQFARTSVGVDAVLIRQGNVEESIAKITNYSEGGFSAWVPSENTINEGIRLKIMNPHGDPLTIEGRIRWQQESTDGNGYQIGCRFVDTKSYESLLTCVPVPMFRRLAIEDKVKWYVIAAALAALLLPPAISLLIQNKTSLPAIAKSTNQQPAQFHRYNDPNQTTDFRSNDNSLTTGLTTKSNNNTNVIERTFATEATPKKPMTVEMEYGDATVVVEPTPEPEHKVDLAIAQKVEFEEHESAVAATQPADNVESFSSPFNEETPFVLVPDDEPAVATEEPAEHTFVDSHTYIDTPTNSEPVTIESVAIEPATVAPSPVEPAPKPTKVESTLVDNSMNEQILELEQSETNSVVVSQTTEAQPKTTEATVVPVAGPPRKKKRHYRRVQKNYGSRTSNPSIRKPAPQRRPAVESKPVSKNSSARPTNSVAKKPAVTTQRVRSKQVFGDTKVGRWMVRHVGPWIPESLKTTKPFTPSERTSAETSSRRNAKQ